MKTIFFPLPQCNNRSLFQFGSVSVFVVHFQQCLKVVAYAFFSWLSSLLHLMYYLSGSPYQCNLYLRVSHLDSLKRTKSHTRMKLSHRFLHPPYRTSLLFLDTSATFSKSTTLSNLFLLLPRRSHP